MARGQPDYGLYQPQFAIAGLADLGEAVARLGSINVYDRRGFTIWMDDFEAPILRWRATYILNGQAPILSTTTSFRGVQSVYFNTPAGVNSASFLDRRFPLIRLGKAGAEFWVQGFTKTIGYFAATFYIYDGTTPNYAELLYDTNAGTISIVHAAGTTVIAANVYMYNLQYYFLPIKLVVDMDSNMYSRLIVGEREFDLSAYQLVALPASTDRYILVGFTVRGSAADDMWMYLDNFILTQNEP